MMLVTLLFCWPLLALLFLTFSVAAVHPGRLGQQNTPLLAKKTPANTLFLTLSFVINLKITIFAK
jgi:hypothetical protein